MKQIRIRRPDIKGFFTKVKNLKNLKPEDIKRHHREKKERRQRILEERRNSRFAKKMQPVYKWMNRLSLPQSVRAGWSAGVITAVELLTGLMVNRDYRVWDYRDQPGNLFGQVCPRFTALWVPVGMAAMGMYRLVDGGLDKLMPSPIPTFGQKREIPRRI